MAKADYVGAVAGAERKEQQAGPVEALDAVAGFGEAENDVDNRAAAVAAGVLDAAYINYGVALTAYEARVDIEDLNTKQTRNAPATFAAAAFMRQRPNRSGGNGYAPDADNAIVGVQPTSSSGV